MEHDLAAKIVSGLNTQTPRHPVEIRRTSRTWSVYADGALVKGGYGFFSQSSAKKWADKWRKSPRNPPRCI
jgi:hypothetical protein